MTPLLELQIILSYQYSYSKSITSQIMLCTLVMTHDYHLQVLKAMMNISETCRIQENGPEIFLTISSSMTDEMDFIIFLMDYVLDLEIKNYSNGFSIKKGVDPVLDKCE